MGITPGGYGEFLEELTSTLNDSIVLWNEPMSRHTSFKIGGPADLLVIPRSIEDTRRVFVGCKRNGVPCYVVGNGTNLLVRDGGIRGAVLKLASGLNGIVPAEETLLEVGAGTLLSDLLDTARNLELSGLEFAVGIPGSVGGAVAMNAGAYGGEIASLVLRVKVLDQEGRILWLGRDDLAFGYRESIFQHRADLMVLGAELKMVKGRKENIVRQMEDYAHRRQEKQPLDMPSAGSAFRRPPGGYVGPLIEKAGLKGFSIGGARVSPKHAGFIVNTGGATAKDVLQLMDTIVTAVYETSGIVLQPEIVVLGEDELPDRSESDDR